MAYSFLADCFQTSQQGSERLAMTETDLTNSPWISAIRAERRPAACGSETGWKGRLPRARLTPKHSGERKQRLGTKHRSHSPKLGLSQPKFARLLGIASARCTIGSKHTDALRRARVLLRVAARHPEVVLEAAA